MKFIRVALIAMLMLVLGSVSTFAQSDTPSAPPSAPPSDDPFVAAASRAVVDTEAGQLQGFVKDGVYTYLGVPYATARRRLDQWFVHRRRCL